MPHQQRTGISISSARCSIARLSWATLVCSLLTSAFHISSSELVQLIAPDGFKASVDWSSPGGDFEPLVRSFCAAEGGCDGDLSSELHSAFLAADLKLWAARDGRNATWDSRAVRLMPPELEDEFTMDARVQHLKFYHDNSVSDAREYSADDVDHLIALARARSLGSAYPNVDRHIYKLAADGYLAAFSGARVVVFGSSQPWYESMAIALGAVYVATVDYLPMRFSYNSSIARIETFLVNDAALHPLRYTFDVAVSISSFEHDGLGRYGDPVNVNGDLSAMATMRTFLKPEGVALVAVPIGADALVWNLHRIYGRVRLPLLLQGWSLLATSGFEDVDLQLNQYNAQQPVMLLAQSAAAPSSSAAPSASAAAASAASVSWNPFLNLPPEACAPQMQELGMCVIEVDHKRRS